ncbi:glycosyl transferase [Mesorhizobium sp. L-8-10]|uniref:glycosyltransferase family 2 protein n=1 Tax=Mesorhizobium sp. L-8-10 TaxID=2744523 RepID=UPI001927DD03|nr:glycosyltransferase [Mesorhizobium sp. L-8-10]BCH35513.1 glycosyl transferase [Mesorhizobium sp. L-8-10]
MDLFSRASVKSTKGRIKRARALDRVPRLSVVIPCYNYGHYLRQCVESVTRNQLGIDIEVVIVDDKSTDDSLDVALSIQSQDKRVRVIRHEQNKGHIATYNDGLEAVTGEFVLLLSADDLVTPGALTRAAELLAAEPSVGLVYGNGIHFSGDLPPSRSGGKGWIIWSGVDWLRDRCREGYNVVASPEVVMRTSVLRAIGGYRPDLPHAGDFEMWLRTSAVSDIGFLIGVDQAYYRSHAVNMNRREFSSGTARGQFVDLKQRWQSFEVVFAGVGSNLDGGLLQTARRTMARQALERVNYAYARGFRDFPTEEFEALAREIQVDVRDTKAGRALARRKRLGMTSLPLHPLWAPSAIAWRIEDLIRRWRCRRIGI